MNPYTQPIDVETLFRLQAAQYQVVLPLEQTIPALSEVNARIDITTLGHFMMQSFTGSYTTKILDGQDPTDDGINHLSIKMLDGSNNRTLFEDYIPASLILSPGREKILPAVGNDSEPLRLEYSFIYTFAMNGAIQVNIKNDSDYENILKMAFKGIRIFPMDR